jgi:formamidopyrimidine-DNA glycosylase
MPELPEVEIMTRNARRWLVGRRFRDVAVLDPRLDAGLQTMRGARVDGAVRRGKFLIVQCDAADLLIHFRMTGRLLRNADRRSVRLRFEIDDGTIVFDDPRRFGTIEHVAPGTAFAALAGNGLGPEIWPTPLPAAEWRARLIGAATLKAGLLDQRRLAGLGNICASEVCFRAGLDPRTPPRALSSGDVARLAEATGAFVDAAVAAEAGDEIRFVAELGEPPEHFAVYGRESERCSRCDGVISRFVMAGRSTFACASCQRQPATTAAPRRARSRRRPARL